MGLRAGTGALALIAALVLVACGGDNGDPGDSDADSFVTAADAACEERYAAEPPNNELDDPKASAAIVEEKLTALRDELAALEAIDVPEDQRADYEAFLELKQEQERLGEQVLKHQRSGQPQPPQLAEQQAEVQREQFELAGSLGLETCGRARYASADPQPLNSIDDAMATLEQVVADGDCDAFAEDVVATSQEPIADQLCEGVLADFDGFTAADAKVDEFGTGAVVEYEGKNGAISQPYVVEGDETWRMASYSFQNQPSVGVEPEADNEYEESVRTGVEAIAADDCKAFAPVADAELQTPEEACAAFAALRVPFTPTPEVEDLGANAYYGFFAIRGERGQYYTAIVARKDDDDAEAVQKGTAYRLAGIETPFR